MIENKDKKEKVRLMVTLLIHVVPAATLSFLIQLIMHEVGHMIGGYITGWRLIYLQVFHLAIVKKDKRLLIVFVPSNNCQCIMYPKSVNSGAKIYTMGGCYVNLLLAILGLIAMLTGYRNMVLWVYYWCFFAVGIVFYLMNGISNTRRICNDKACSKLLKSDTNTRLCHNAQLIIARHLNEGNTYERIGEEFFDLSGDKADNDILAYHAVLEFYFHLETGNYAKMVYALEKIDMEAPISRGVRNIIILERLYSEMIMSMINGSKSPLDERKYMNNIREYIKRYDTKGDVHSVRVKATYNIYDLLNKGNITDAYYQLDYIISDIEKMKCIYEGEKLFCISQLHKLYNIISSNITNVV